MLSQRPHTYVVLLQAHVRTAAVGTMSAHPQQSAWENDIPAISVAYWSGAGIVSHS